MMAVLVSPDTFPELQGPANDSVRVPLALTLNCAPLIYFWSGEGFVVFPGDTIVGINIVFFGAIVPTVVDLVCPPSQFV